VSKDLKNEKSNLAKALRSFIWIVIAFMVIAVMELAGNIYHGEDFIPAFSNIYEGFISVVGLYAAAEIVQILHDIRRKLYDK